MAYRLEGDVLVARDMNVSGSVLAGDGDATVPAYAFLSDPDTGLYYTTNTIRFAIAGTQELYLRANELAPLADGGLSLGTTVAGFDNIYGQQSGGSAGTPTFAWSGDTDTGFYKVGADQVGIAAGASNVAVFANTSSNPQVILDDGSGAVPSIAFAGENNLGFYNHATNTIAFAAGNVRRILFNSSYIRVLDNGTVGAPVYSWINRTSDGFWSVGSGIVGVSGLGTEVVRFDGSGATPQVLFADGTNSLPSLAFTSDPDTGIYNGGTAATIRLAMGGVFSYQFNATSFAPIASGIDLGTFGGFRWADAYISRLLAGTGSVGAPGISFEDDTNTGIFRSTSDTMNFVTNASSRMIINNSAVRVTTEVRLENGSVSNPTLTFETANTTGIYRPTDGWDTTNIGFTIRGDEVARFENDNAWDDGNLQITKDLIQATAVEQVWEVDGGSFTDITAAATSSTGGDTQLFVSSSAIGDFMAIGMDQEFVAFVVNATNGTAGTGNHNVAWQYWDGADWAALTVLRDDTNDFTTLDDGLVFQFVRPTDWATTTLNTVEKYYVRAYLSGAYTVSPIIDQVNIVADQIGLNIVVPDASVIGAGTYNRTDAIRITSAGVPGGTVTFRYICSEYQGDLNFSIESLTGGGTGMFLPQSNNPAYAFVDGNGATDSGIGLGADTGQQRVSIYTSGSTESARFEAAQVFLNDGSAAAPGLSFITEDDIGIFRSGSNKLALAGGLGESVVVDNGSATPVFRPDVDDTWDLGEANFRWKTIRAVTSSIGDLTMKNPEGGKQHWKLVEGHDTIWLFNIQTGQKFKMAMEAVEMTPEDENTIQYERAKYPELYGEE